MTRHVLAALCPLLVGCYTLPTAARPYDTRPYPHRAQLMAWVAWGLPIGDCDDAELYVQRLPNIDAVKRVCGAKLAGCAQLYSTGFLGTDSAYVLHIVAHDENQREPDLRAHETAHVFVHCGLRRGDWDYRHTDKRVWPHMDEQRQWIRAAMDAIREVQP